MNMGQKVRQAIAMTGLALAAVGTQAAPSSYAIVDLGALTGFSRTSATDINDFGQVVLFGGEPDTAGNLASGTTYLWTPTAANASTGSLTTLPKLGGSLATGIYLGTAINSSGTVVGRIQLGVGGGLESFAWTPNSANATSGTTTQVSVGSAGTNTGVTDINDSGVIVGSYRLAAFPNRQHGFRLTGSTVTDLGDVPTSGADSNDFSDASAVNNAGQIVGQSATNLLVNLVATSWASGATTPTSLNDLTGGSISAISNDINASGQIVGVGEGANGNRGFLIPSGTANALSAANPGRVLFDPLGGTEETEATALNDAGEVVGNSTTGGPEADWLPFLYTSAGGVQDLNDLVVDALSGGIKVTSVIGINSLGQIVGRGVDANGRFTAVLLVDAATAVPLPAAIWLLGPALLGVVGIGRRRNPASAA